MRRSQEKANLRTRNSLAGYFRYLVFLLFGFLKGCQNYSETVKKKRKIYLGLSFNSNGNFIFPICSWFMLVNERVLQ